MKTNESIISDIKKMLDEKDMSASELARRVGMAKSAVSRYLNHQREFPLNKAHLFANALGVQTEELIGLKPNIETVPIHTVPVVASISAGQPMFSEENIISKLYIGAPMIKKNGNQYFGLVIKGDSMDRELKEGDVVIVEKDAHIENGQIAVVRVNGDESTVKRVKYKDNHIILMPNSNNPEHTPQFYTEDDDINFIGKVIGMNRTF